MFQVILPEKASIRAEIMGKLHELGIGTGVHYPAIHLFKLYQDLGWKPGDFPHAEIIGRSILTLPLFPAMTTSDVTRVTSALLKVLQS